MKHTFSYLGIGIKLTIGEDALVKKVEFVKNAPRASEISYAELQDYDADFSNLTPFQKAVLKKTQSIPLGRVSTYGELARAVKKPRAARAVGSAMTKNPFPVLVPCHRVIKSDLSLGEYSSGTKLKRKLLESEGVGCEGNKVRREFAHRF